MHVFLKPPRNPHPQLHTEKKSTKLRPVREKPDALHCSDSSTQPAASPLRKMRMMRLLGGS